MMIQEHTTFNCGQETETGQYYAYCHHYCQQLGCVTSDVSMEDAFKKLAILLAKKLAKIDQAIMGD